MLSTLPSAPELDRMSTTDPEIAEMLKHVPLPAPPSAEPEALIAGMRAYARQVPVPPPRPAVQETTKSYQNRAGSNLRLVAYRPAGAQKLLPLVVWYHGGGGCIGAPEMNAVMHRDWATTHECVVIAPEYRLGPEHPWPAGQHDAWDALVHLARNAADFGADPKLGFLVGGESAGAVMSAVLALEAKEESLSPPLTGTFLSAGSYFNPNDIPREYSDLYRSRTDPVCVQSPMLSETSKHAFNVCLAPDYTSRLYRAALWDDHRGLPRTYLQTCGWDINRDDGILYRHLLQRHGVETKLSIYEGCPHCFWFLFPKSRMGHRWKEDCHEGIKWLLTR